MLLCKNIGNRGLVTNVAIKQRILKYVYCDVHAMVLILAMKQWQHYTDAGSDNLTWMLVLMPLHQFWQWCCNVNAGRDTSDSNDCYVGNDAVTSTQVMVLKCWQWCWCKQQCSDTDIYTDVLMLIRTTKYGADIDIQAVTPLCQCWQQYFYANDSSDHVSPMLAATRGHQ